MKHAKICTNELCTEKKKKRKKESEIFCPYCGQSLSHVCKYKKCLAPIDPASEDAYCPIHLEEAKRKAERNFEIAKKATFALATVGFSAYVICHGLGIKKEKKKKKKK